jgi:hypothetical protein
MRVYLMSSAVRIDLFTLLKAPRDPYPVLDDSPITNESYIIMAQNSTLEQRIQLIEDKFALASLLNRYCNTADNHQWDDFSQCFLADGIMGFESWPEVKGRDKIAAAAGGAEDRFEGLQHSMTNMEFVVDGNEASGTAYLWFSATMDVSKPREHHAFGGHYKFNFQRTEEGWRIARMRLRKTWAQNDDVQGVFG